MGPIDVIMPAYNADDWIVAAVRSLDEVGLARSLTIVDDGSTTPVRETLSERLAENTRLMRVEVLERENGGESAARNTGIDHVIERTAGEPGWVMFFDADDLLLPTAASACEDAERADAGAMVGARVCFWPTGRERVASPPEDLEDRLLPSPHAAFRYLQVYASTGMTVRRDLLQNGLRWDEAIPVCPDIEFLHRVALAGARLGAPVWVSSSPMLRYRLHDDGQNLSGSSNIDRRIAGFVYTVERHHEPANDALFRHQARWLLNQSSKYSAGTEWWGRLVELHRAYGWPMRAKPRLRMSARQLGAVVGGSKSA